MHASRINSAARRLRRITFSALFLTLAAGCGYKGPLYMPPPPAPDESLTAPPSTQPPGASTNPGSSEQAPTPGIVPAQ